MKKMVDVSKEFVKKVNDDDLRFLHVRFSQRIGSDMAEAIQYLQRIPEMDRWLSTASTSQEFLGMVDHVENCIQNEFFRRSMGKPVPAM